MSTSLQDYVELLNAEQLVQVDKLREHARHGVHPQVRGEVWMYLLAVLSPSRTSEITSLHDLNEAYISLGSSLPSHITSTIVKAALAHHTHRFFNPTYANLISDLTSEQPTLPPAPPLPPPHSSSSTTPNPTSTSSALRDRPSSARSSPHLLSDPRAPPPSIALPPSIDDTPTLRSQHMRFLPPPPAAPPSRHVYLGMVEEVLGKYYRAELAAGRDAETRRAERAGLGGAEREWVWLVTPFACCLTRPAAVFYAFQKLMDKMRSFPPIPSRLASLLALFRLAIPELFSYFEDEQVPYIQIAMSWLTTLLAKEMWLGDVLRLWDAYFASDDMFALHCYVCVSILNHCKETLEELDGSEAKLMLLDLPPLDVDRLLQDAANLRVAIPLPRPVSDNDDAG